MKCRSRQKNSQPKDPNEPVKPPKPYIRYSRSVWEKIANDNPGMNIGQIGNAVGRLWRNLPEEDKEVFNQEHKEDLVKYEIEMKLYYKSARYKEWLKKVEETNSIKSKDSQHKSNNFEKLAPVKMMPLTENSYIEVDLDSDEDVNFMDIKMESSGRFYRNHALMLELFSDTRVPSAINVNVDNEERDAELESQILQIRKDQDEINTKHFHLLMEIERKNQTFKQLMRLEQEKMQNLIETPQL